MNTSNLSSKRHSCMVILTILSASLFFFNCSELYLSSWSCVETEGHQCKRTGDTSWLIKKPLDVLVVMDNSSKGKKLNSQITANLNQFVRCIEPVDWRLGIISGVEDEDNSSTALGHLMNIEVNGEISTEKFISVNTIGYQKILSDTVSLRSGCDYPPYCNKGSHKPLSAVKAFMEMEAVKGGANTAFLRDYAPLTIIFVSSSDEETGMFSSSGTSPEMALSSVYNHYSENKFMALTAVKPGNKDNCLTTFGDTTHNGMEHLTTAGEIYGMVTLNPVVVFGSSLLSDISESVFTDKPPEELVNFAKSSGGYAFNICKPAFGKAMAYSVLKKNEYRRSFSRKMRRVEKIGILRSC